MDTWSWAEAWPWIKWAGASVLSAIGGWTILKSTANWARKTMVQRTADKIFSHMEKEFEAKYLRVHGPAGRLLEPHIGNMGRQVAHQCSPTCVKRGHVLGAIERMFMVSAFKHLASNDPRVVFKAGFYYIKGTEPEG
jgi:hypothetical protein